MTVIKEIRTAVSALLKDQQDLPFSDLAHLAEEFFRQATAEEFLERSPSELAGRIVDLYQFILERDKGSSKVRLFNPEVDKNGWDSAASVIQLNNPDGPFLVDSISLLLADRDIGIHHLFHPVINVVRDADGKLLKILTENEAKTESDFVAESVIYLVIDRLSKDRLQRIKKSIYKVLAELKLVVSGWRPMTAKALETSTMLVAIGNAEEQEDAIEAGSFIRWLAEDNFIFFGYREYKVSGSGEKKVLQVVPQTGLGILDEEHSPGTPRPLPSLPAIKTDNSADKPDLLIITKTSTRSSIHRSGYMDYVGVKIFNKHGKAIGEHRFIGLFTSNAYTRSAWDTPLIRARVEAVMEHSKLRPESHAWKALIHILETLPRDELFQSSVEELVSLSMSILKLQERQSTRLLIRRELFGRFYSCMLFIPRDRFNTENRQAIQAILKRSLKGERIDYQVLVSDSPLARLHIVVRPRSGEPVEYDVAEIEAKIVKAVRSWEDELRQILIQKLGESDGLKVFERFHRAVPLSYTDDVSPWVASFDLQNMAMLEGESDLGMSLYRPRKKRMGVLRFKIFKYTRPIPLTEVLPMLENLGLSIVSERPYEFRLSQDKSIWVQDFDMVLATGEDLDIEAVREIMQQAFEMTWRGGNESDGFNRLVLAARLRWRQITILRAYSKYLLQTGIPFSQAYMETTLESHPVIARLLVELFETIFDPRRKNESEAGARRRGGRLQKVFAVLHGDPSTALGECLKAVVDARGSSVHKDQIKTLKAAIVCALESVSSLDQDRILRAFCNLILATLRTNYFCSDEAGEPKEYLSFKFDSAQVTDLPKPCPFREIWVYSPRVEGIHLRMGKVARGGLRWSDRREDFRTEVLGLMKAQNVKNTMIVPVGAKGGFVVKRMPEGDRETVMEEVIHCYQSFIRGLLDISDNLSEDEVLPPMDVVRLDEDDPYLVVAADKGTATFSDIANGVAEEYGFWLGDAFASGGSVGYDHKVMGITAKGAWESVKRHFRELDIDTQAEDFTVVGIGDMAGDVFGNGMLLSRHICLQAAFNHMHIFLDPTPDAESSFVERQRLFDLPRSSWDDYNRKLISKGGGIYSRQSKSIKLSPQVRDWLGVDAKQMAPAELIRLLLKARVDLLWNGGIGTYVKASSETNADAGDTANNGLRINGAELRCKVVGEGGNLGLTQLGRVEYALAGGRINTDFIDNSAGVDCSDHEVNIKILLNQVMRQGKLELDSRNELLVEMTDDVDQLVLRSNYLQTQTISMMERLTGARLGAKAHFIQVLEQQGLLDRELEFLPTDDDIEQRRTVNKGLTRPELSTLLSYAKIVLYQQLLESSLPDDNYLRPELFDYFPSAIQKRFAAEMHQHRMKREIITTMVTNSIVNRMGASFCLLMQESTGHSPEDVTRAYLIARDAFDLNPLWLSIEALDNKVSAAIQTDALLVIWKVLRQAVRWLLVQPGAKLDIQLQVERLRPGISSLMAGIAGLLSKDDQRLLGSQVQRYVDAGATEKLSKSLALLPRLTSALDIVDEAGRKNLPVEKVAEVYFQLGQTMNLKWLMQQIEELAVDGQWDAAARNLLREELFRQHRGLAGQVLMAYGDASNGAVNSWLKENRDELDRVIEMLADMRTLQELDYATISVAVNALRSLIKEPV